MLFYARMRNRFQQIQALIRLLKAEELKSHRPAGEAETGARKPELKIILCSTIRAPRF